MSLMGYIVSEFLIKVELLYCYLPTMRFVHLKWFDKYMKWEIPPHILVTSALSTN